jgi:hypothetical protein
VYKWFASVCCLFCFVVLDSSSHVWMDGARKKCSPRIASLPTSRGRSGALMIGTLLVHFVGIDPRLHGQIIIIIIIYLCYGPESRIVTTNQHLNT